MQIVSKTGIKRPDAMVNFVWANAYLHFWVTYAKNS